MCSHCLPEAVCLVGMHRLAEQAIMQCCPSPGPGAQWHLCKHASCGWLSGICGCLVQPDMLQSGAHGFCHMQVVRSMLSYICCTPGVPCLQPQLVSEDLLSCAAGAALLAPRTCFHVVMQLRGCHSAAVHALQAPLQALLSLFKLLLSDFKWEKPHLCSLAQCSTANSRMRLHRSCAADVSASVERWFCDG